MPKHSHDFVETYDGFVGFGFDRPTDENAMVYYLQKFSDDAFIQTLVKRLSAGELEELFSMLTRLMKTHLSEAEYHALFLKDADHDG
ncbi:MAG: cytoplasmic protein [Desulfobacterales bacterium]